VLGFSRLARVPSALQEKRQLACAASEAPIGLVYGAEHALFQDLTIRDNLGSAFV